MSNIREHTLYVLAFIIIISSIIYTQTYIDKYHLTSKETISFLPAKNQLKYTTFGYKSIIADMIWIKSSSYFFAHLGGDNDYKYLGAMYDTCIELDPKFKQVYKDVMVFLMNEPEYYHQGEALMLKGVKNLPNDWEIHYLTGLLYSFYLKDHKKSIIHFAKAQTLVPRDDKHRGRLDNINILMRTNSEKEFGNKELVQYWVSRFNRNNSKPLEAFIKKNISKYLNNTMTDILNNKKAKNLGPSEKIQWLKKGHQDIIQFCQKNKLQDIIKINWKKIFIKEDTNGYQWLYSNHQKKYYSYGNAHANLSRKIYVLNNILWRTLKPYYTISYNELLRQPYDTRTSFVKLKPSFKSFPTLKEAIKKGLKFKLETPLYPLYDPKKGFFTIPKLSDLPSIPEEFK